MHRLLLAALVLLFGFAQPHAPAPAWHTMTPGPILAAAGLAARGPDGRIYVVGFSRPDPPSGMAVGPPAAAAYDTRTHTWSRLADPFGDLGWGLAASGGKIYMVGGNLLGGNTNVHIYTPEANRWAAGHPTHGPNQYCAVAAAPDGHVYAVGGGPDDGFVGADFEALDPRTGRWADLSPLPLALAAAAVTVGPDGRLYVLGGVTDNRRPSGRAGVPDRYDIAVTNRVEAYSPRTRRWTRLAPLPTARAALAAVTGRDGRIYAVGGTPDRLTSTQNHPLKVVEVYDPRTNRWSTGPSLRAARLLLSAVAAPDGKIYAIGGASVDTIETLSVPAAPGT